MRVSGKREEQPRAASGTSVPDKAAGPDGLPERVVQACVNQLASVFTDIFNLSLTESVILTCFKQTTIVPVPKNTKVT